MLPSSPADRLTAWDRARQAKLANAPLVSMLFKTAPATLAMSGFPCRPFTSAICDSSCLFCKKSARYAAPNPVSVTLFVYKLVLPADSRLGLWSSPARGTRSTVLSEGAEAPLSR